VGEVLAPLGEAEAAPKVWKNGRWEAKRPPPGKAVLTEMIEGKPTFWLVEKRMAEMFEAEPAPRQDAILKVYEFGFRKFLYPLFVTYNPGWGVILNPQKDFNRTLRNLPGAAGGNIAAARKLAKHYRAAWEIAAAKMRREPHPILQEMMENAAIGNPFDSFTSNIWGQDDPAKMAAAFDLLSAEEQRKAQGDWLEKAGTRMEAALTALETTGRMGKIGAGVLRTPQHVRWMNEMMEAVGKIAPYTLLTREMGMPAREAAIKVRNELSTPNWLKRGTHVRLFNVVRPFVNIWWRSWESSFQMATGKETRGMWWWRWASGSGMLTTIKALAVCGALGEGLKELMKGISEYRKTNYHILPLGTRANLKSPTGKSVVGIQLPMHEEDRVVNGILFRLITGVFGDSPVSGWDKWRGLFAGAARELPGVNPVEELRAGWSTWLQGQIPIDDFTGRPVMSDEEALRGKGAQIWAMLRFTGQTMGLGAFYRPNPDGSWGTAVFSAPLANKLVFDTAAGYREEQRAIDQQAAEERARIRAVIPEEAQRLAKYYSRLRSRGERRTEHEAWEYARVAGWYNGIYRRAMEALEKAVLDDGMSEAEARKMAQSWDWAIPAEESR